MDNLDLLLGVDYLNESLLDLKFRISPLAFFQANTKGAEAELNGLKNVEYHCGKAEEILPNLLKRFINDKVVAIVDPPRAGLHIKVIQSLRHLNNLVSLIYVSCNPELAMGNFIE